jgi:hypothetical protein
MILASLLYCLLNLCAFARAFLILRTYHYPKRLHHTHITPTSHPHHTTTKETKRFVTITMTNRPKLSSRVLRRERGRQGKKLPTTETKQLEQLSSSNQASQSVRSMKERKKGYQKTTPPHGIKVA